MESKTFLSLFLIFISIQVFANEELTSLNEPEQLFVSQRILSVVPSPDKKQVAFITNHMKTSPKGTQWVYTLYLKNENEKIESLFQANNISSLEWSADAKSISYLSNGKSFQSIFTVDLKTKENIKFFEFISDITSFKRSPNGQSIAFIAPKNQPTPTAMLKAIDMNQEAMPMRLYILDLSEAKGKRKIAEPLTGEDYSVSQFSINGAFDWSPDSESIAFSYQPHAGAAYEFQNKIGIVNIKSRELQTLAYSESHNSIQPTYSPDGKWLAFQANLSDDEASKAYPSIKSDTYSPTLLIKSLVSKICIYNTESRETHCLSNTFNEMPSIIGWNSSSDSIFVYDSYKSTGFQIYSLSLNPAISATDISLVDGYIEPLTITLNSTGTQFGFGYETTLNKPQVFVSNTDPFKLNQISHFKKADTKSLGSTETLRWKSKDGTDIEGFLIKPSNFDPNKKYPLFVSLHGGPSGRWDKRYLGACDEYANSVEPTSCFQVILNLGFIIFKPNPRGSTGFGSEFRLANFADLGGDDYQDIMTGIDYLIENKIADPEHLAIGGWSYGGYMTTWIISQTNRFKAAIEGSGFTDFISMSGTSDIPDFHIGYLGSTFWDNNKLYLERSPIFHVKNISTPLLILHGENDSRVPVTQGYELFNSLKKQNKPVKMIVLPKQGHLPTDANLILESIREIEQWLKKAL